MVRWEAAIIQYLDNNSAIMSTYPLNSAVGKTIGEVDEEEDMKEGDKVDEVGVGRDFSGGNTVLLITEV